jgi:hypothetical protein
VRVYFTHTSGRNPYPTCAKIDIYGITDLNRVTVATNGFAIQHQLTFPYIFVGLNVVNEAILAAEGSTRGVKPVLYLSAMISLQMTLFIDKVWFTWKRFKFFKFSKRLGVDGEVTCR